MDLSLLLVIPRTQAVPRLGADRSTRPRSDRSSNQRMSALYYDCLLGLPETSDAFSAHPKIVSTPKNKGVEKLLSSPHPRKTPKLAWDADSASSSRSRGVGTPSSSRDAVGVTRGDGDVVMRDGADEDVAAAFVLRIEGAPCKSRQPIVPQPAQHLHHFRQTCAARWLIHLRMSQPHHQVSPALLHKTTVSRRSDTSPTSEFLV